MLLLALASSCASSGGLEEVPVATVGATPRAEREFRPLMRRWVLGNDAQRQALDARLQEFIRRHKGDDLTRYARVLRAWNALERGDHAQGRSLARDGFLGPPGVPRDLALLVIGAIERREGKHRQALATLSPLLHKMLDDFATERLNEELTLAAVGARRWSEALKYMEAWLFEAEAGDEDSVGERVKQLLSQMPNRQLLAALDRRTRDRGNVATTKLLAQQLAVQAVERRDAQLARALLDRYGPLLGRYGEAVARLAIDTAREFVAARTVGVLLSLRTPGLRRRSTDVVAGMNFGLGLPGSQARLVTRDASTGSDVTRALHELASEGAAVVVAGVDPVHSALVAQHAREESLPVILLLPESDASPSPFVFVIGEPPERTAGQLVAALKAGGARTIHAIGTSLGAGQELGMTREHGCGELPNETELASIDALVLYDGAECATAAAGLARAEDVELGVGLGVPGLEQPPAAELTAGLFPVNESKPPASMRGWFGARHGPLGWWSALGRDAAILAWAAVHDLGEAKSETKEVEARRVEATSALAAARAELWTSEAKGFDANQRLPRRISVRRKGRADKP